MSDPPSTSDVIDLAQRASANAALSRIRDACARSTLGTLPNGTGGARSYAARERAQLAYEHACASGAVTWRRILHKHAASVCAETSPEKLTAALVRLGVVVVKWIEAVNGQPP